jgi:hypothetical protein
MQQEKLGRSRRVCFRALGGEGDRSKRTPKVIQPPLPDKEPMPIGAMVTGLLSEVTS